MTIPTDLQQQAEKFAQLVELKQVVDQSIDNLAIQEYLANITDSDSILKSTNDYVYTGILAIILNSINSERLNNSCNLFSNNVVTVFGTKKFIATFLYCNKEVYPQFSVAKNALSEIIKRDEEQYCNWTR